MAAGKPIVSFAGSARNLTHLENGWVVKGEDIHGFVDAIIALINDRSLREKLGASARKYMQESYMWSNRAETIHTVYEDILNH
jgi:glycosyltransferase involved in cell wall biosynthesis